jgi:hypothetical protein
MPVLLSVSQVPTTTLPSPSQPLPVTRPLSDSSVPLSQTLPTSQVPTSLVQVSPVLLLPLVSAPVANITQAPLTVIISEADEDLLDDGSNISKAPSQQHQTSSN